MESWRWPLRARLRRHDRWGYPLWLMASDPPSASHAPCPSGPPAQPPARLLLCSDLDRTLVPNGPESESAEARGLFARLVRRPQVTLAYVSGRDPALVAEAIERYALPAPAWVVADVGTTILEGSPAGWIRHRGWDGAIAADWGGRSGEELRPLLADLPELRLQEPGRQSLHKLSFYVDAHLEVAPLRARIEARLAEAGLAASVIHSLDGPAGVGLLDVLPASATKLHAVRFLMASLGFGRDDTLFAGDSGNDLPVLQSELRSILVANADPAVKVALGLPARTGTADTASAAAAAQGRIYLARGAFMGMNGNYAAGVVEGVLHHCPGAAAWLEAPGLTHLNSRGEARMVEVGERPPTLRSAVAEGFISMAPELLAAVMEGRTAKGDVLAVARVAAIQAAKRTSELIPLCHPLALTGLDVTIEPQEQRSALRVEVVARTTGPTGVEMEALTAVQVGLLTLYDMVKSCDPAMTIGPVRLLRKDGGRHGVWVRPEAEH